MAANAALTQIIQKIRLITKSPSQNQITDSQIIQYINTYYLYDFPQELRLKNCLSNYTFVTTPNQDTYPLPTSDIITIEPPVYINGYQSFFTQSQENFFMLYPYLGVTNQIITGNGTVGPYSFTLQNFPVFQRQVVVTAIDGAGNSMTATDIPLSATSGTLTGASIVTGSTINYVTGAINITFTSAVPGTNFITCQISPYQPSRPVAMLFYNDVITLRPVPDNAYQVNVQAYINPLTALMGQSFNPPTLGGSSDKQYPTPPNAAILPTGFANNTDTPQLLQWWQLIAWGAALKIFEDRGDIENIARFKPLYDQQRIYVLRRTLVEMANERTATIYTEQTQYPIGNFFNQF